MLLRGPEQFHDDHLRTHARGGRCSLPGFHGQQPTHGWVLGGALPCLVGPRPCGPGPRPGSGLRADPPATLLLASASAAVEPVQALLPMEPSGLGSLRRSDVALRRAPRDRVRDITARHLIGRVAPARGPRSVAVSYTRVKCRTRLASTSPRLPLLVARACVCRLYLAHPSHSLGGVLCHAWSCPVLADRAPDRDRAYGLIPRPRCSWLAQRRGRCRPCSPWNLTGLGSLRRSDVALRARLAIELRH